ncbi:hypothetical protein [Streptomyces sp. NPDC001100]
MPKIAGLVATVILAVASLSTAGETASVALADDGIGWDSMGGVAALHAPGERAVTLDNVVSSL